MMYKSVNFFCLRRLLLGFGVILKHLTAFWSIPSAQTVNLLRPTHNYWEYFPVEEIFYRILVTFISHSAHLYISPNLIPIINQWLSFLSIHLHFFTICLAFDQGVKCMNVSFLNQHRSFGETCPYLREPLLSVLKCSRRCSLTKQLDSSCARTRDGSV